MSADENLTKPHAKRPGPDAERLKIEGDWKDAMKKAIPQEKPPEGWPRGAEGDDDGAESPESMDADT